MITNNTYGVVLIRCCCRAHDFARSFRECHVILSAASAVKYGISSTIVKTTPFGISHANFTRIWCCWHHLRTWKVGSVKNMTRNTLCTISLVSVKKVSKFWHHSIENRLVFISWKFEHVSSSRFGYISLRTHNDFWGDLNFRIYNHNMCSFINFFKSWSNPFFQGVPLVTIWSRTQIF